MAVVDVRLPPSFRDEGLRAALEARRRVPGTPVLVVSQYVEQTYAVELLADGGAGIGYLLKDRIADPADFVEACAGSPPAARRWIPRWWPSWSHAAGAARPAALTPREREVLELMAEGRSNAAIAAPWS